LDVWDPIGVKDAPNAQDEYDSYIGRLYELLVSKAPDVELVEHLYWAAHDSMGLSAAQRSDMVSTVEALKRIPYVIGWANGELLSRCKNAEEKVAELHDQLENTCSGTQQQRRQFKELRSVLNDVHKHIVAVSKALKIPAR
jgi:septation ring formation regulator EzrA